MKYILTDFLCESNQNVELCLQALSLDIIKTFRAGQASKENSIYLGKNVFYRDRLCGLVVRVSGYRYRGPGL